MKQIFFELIGSGLENYTSNNTTQHETTQVQHKATGDNTIATRDNTSTTRDNTLRNNIKFTLICLYHRCILGAWYIKL